MGASDFIKDLEPLPSFKHIDFLQLFFGPKLVNFNRQVGDPAVLVFKNLGKTLKSAFVCLEWPVACHL